MSMIDFSVGRQQEESLHINGLLASASKSDLSGYPLAERNTTPELTTPAMPKEKSTQQRQ